MRKSNFLLGLCFLLSLSARAQFTAPVQIDTPVHQIGKTKAYWIANGIKRLLAVEENCLRFIDSANVVLANYDKLAEEKNRTTAILERIKAEYEKQSRDYHTRDSLRLLQIEDAKPSFFTKAFSYIGQMSVLVLIGFLILK